jgi:hypothetical protein
MLSVAQFRWADPSSLAAIGFPCNLSMIYIGLTQNRELVDRKGVGE